MDENKINWRKIDWTVKLIDERLKIIGGAGITSYSKNGELQFLYDLRYKLSGEFKFPPFKERIWLD